MIKHLFTVLISILCFLLGSGIVWTNFHTIHAGVIARTTRFGPPHPILLARSPIEFWLYTGAVFLFGLILMVPAVIVVKQAIGRKKRNRIDQDLEDFFKDF